MQEKRVRERGRVEREGGGCLQADNTLNHRWLSKAAIAADREGEEREEGEKGPEQENRREEVVRGL